MLSSVDLPCDGNACDANRDCACSICKQHASSLLCSDGAGGGASGDPQREFGMGVWVWGRTRVLPVISEEKELALTTFILTVHG